MQQLRSLVREAWYRQHHARLEHIKPDSIPASGHDRFPDNDFCSARQLDGLGQAAK
jgi:hypothetical protein